MSKEIFNRAVNYQPDLARKSGDLNLAFWSTNGMDSGNEKNFCLAPDVKRVKPKNLGPYNLGELVQNGA